MFERNNKEVSLAEFATAMKTIGLEIGPNAVAMGVAIGNGRVRVSWSDPVEVKTESKKNELASPKSTSVKHDGNAS